MLDDSSTVFQSIYVWELGGGTPHSDVTQNDVRFLNACVKNSIKNRFFINFQFFFQYSEFSFCDSHRGVEIIKFGQFYNKLCNFKKS